MITAPNCKVRSIENTTKMLLIVFFLKVWFYKLNTDFTSSHSENKLTVYHDLKRLLVDVHWVLLCLVQRKSAKLEGRFRSESAGSPHSGSFFEAQFNQGVFATSCQGHSPPPQTPLCWEAGYNCLLALSVPLWLQDRGGCFI